MINLFRKSRFARAHDVPTCFKMSAAWWRDPDSPLIFSSMNVDMTNALDWVRSLRERTGEVITITHLCTKALGMVLRKFPQINAKVEGNRIYRRKTADVVLMVSLDAGEDISAFKVSDVDRKNLLEVSREIRKSAAAVRENRGPSFQASKDLMKYCSILMVKWLLKGASILVNRLGIDLTRLGFPDDPFGSAAISSVNMHGIESAYGPLIPVGRCGFLLVVPEIKDRPWAENGRVVVRPVLKLCMTFDHRIFHGFYVSLVENEIRRLLQNPEELLEGKRLIRGKGNLYMLEKAGDPSRSCSDQDEGEVLLAGYGA
jgi:pyruvate/2-oxoglutarate dehydrogenase complex dihydrolipoamide acyltransferase (E2) component